MNERRREDGFGRDVTLHRRHARGGGHARPPPRPGRRTSPVGFTSADTRPPSRRKPKGSLNHRIRNTGAGSDDTHTRSIDHRAKLRFTQREYVAEGNTGGTGSLYEIWEQERLHDVGDRLHFSRGATMPSADDRHVARRGTKRLTGGCGSHDVDVVDISCGKGNQAAICIFHEDKRASEGPPNAI